MNSRHRYPLLAVSVVLIVATLLFTWQIMNASHVNAAPLTATPTATPAATQDISVRVVYKDFVLNDTTFTPIAQTSITMHQSGAAMVQTNYTFMPKTLDSNNFIVCSILVDSTKNATIGDNRLFALNSFTNPYIPFGGAIKLTKGTHTIALGCLASPTTVNFWAQLTITATSGASAADTNIA